MQSGVIPRFLEAIGLLTFDHVNRSYAHAWKSLSCFRSCVAILSAGIFRIWRQLIGKERPCPVVAGQLVILSSGRMGFNYDNQMANNSPEL